MKALRFLLLSIFSALVLAACGGGGGGSNATSNTVYTLPHLVNLIPTTASTLTFNVSGQDNQGHTFSGTVSYKNAGPVTVSGTNYLELDELISLTSNLGILITSTTNFYLDPTTKLLVYSYDASTGVTKTVVTSNLAPATAMINDSGSLNTFSISNGDTESGTWQLKANTANADLVESYVTKDNTNTVTFTEDQTYTIDPAGNILTLTIHTDKSSSNYTLDVSGSPA